MGRLEKLPCIKENGQLVFANPENGCWVKMPLEVYQRYTNTGCGSRQLSGYLQSKYHLFQPIVDKKDTLRSVYYAVTGRCNMCCSFCTMNSGPDVSKDADLTLEEIKYIVVPKLKELEPKKIVLTGGEPFIREDMVDIIELFGKNFNKSIITLQTNGLLLTKDIICKIADHVGAIEVSIENLFSNREHLTKMKEIFTECNVAKIALSFSFVVNDSTRMHIKEAMDLSHAYHAAFSLRIVSMLGRARINNADDDMNRECSKREIYIEVLRHIIKRGYCEEKISGMFLFQPQLRKYCGAFGNICAIHADGRIYMCENFKSERYSLGNIRHDDILLIQKQVFQKMKTEDFIKEFIMGRPAICMGCNVKEFCTGPCAAERVENITGTMEGCIIRDRLLCFNLFHKDKKKTKEENLKRLFEYLTII